MPLPTLTLDDRSYADLVEEARKRIPALCPGWTDHNPTDPGMVLIEMLAWLTEMLIYRVDEVTDDSRRAFLRLLTGKEPQGKDLDTLIADAVNDLRKPYRAVTKEDYELLAMQADRRVARAYCLPRFYLAESDDSTAIELRGYVSVIVVPTEQSGALIEDIKKTVSDDLADRRLLTTRVCVCKPRYVDIKLTVTVRALPDQDEGNLQKIITEAIAIFFSPLPSEGVIETKSGVIENKTGWPFGRSLYASELYALLDRLPGVNYVESVSIERSKDAAEGQRLSEDGSDKGKVALQPYQLPRIVDVKFKPADTKQLSTSAPKTKVMEP